MSQRQNSDREYLSRSPPKTDRVNPQSRFEPDRPQHTERQLHQQSPTRHDVEYYVRKVNRLESQLARVEHDLSVTRFRLTKTQDIENKYEYLFKENQNTVALCADTTEQLDLTRKQLDKLRIDHDQANQQIKNLQSQVTSERRNGEDLRQKREQLRTKSTSQGQEERQTLKESFTRQLETLKQQNREASERFKKEIHELKEAITMKEVIETTLAAKLEHIKKEKNAEITRLKDLVSGLRDDLGQTHCASEDRARKSRSDLITETEDRIANVRSLAQLIEDTLMEEVKNLNNTLTKKNEEINFLTECDKKQLEDHEHAENNYRRLIGKLEDKIFTVQRENQLELYHTIERLKNQYNDNMAKAREEWDQIRLAHASQVDSLKKEIDAQNKELRLLNSENLTLEGRHKQSIREQQHTVQMFSQKVLGMEQNQAQNLRNYTTSMKQIEDDAKTKMDDLHTAIQSKNSQNEIINAQLTLKNGQITHLLEEIDRLREINRQKLKKLENTNASEQDALNNQISDLKKSILRLKSKIHELECQITDDESAHQLESQLLKAELQCQRQANELLISRNRFLNEWADELDRDLKAERVANVNILHDHNITHRENVQVKEHVRVEIEASKDKEVQQIRNIHKLEKTRLEADLNRREHDLRDKTEELGRLLVQYKNLESKMGKSSKVDRSAEDAGKCRATLEAQILLTENIFNAINTQ